MLQYRRGAQGPHPNPHGDVARVGYRELGDASTLEAIKVHIGASRAQDRDLINARTREALEYSHQAGFVHALILYRSKRECAEACHHTYILAASVNHRICVGNRTIRPGPYINSPKRRFAQMRGLCAVFGRTHTVFDGIRTTPNLALQNTQRLPHTARQSGQLRRTEQQQHDYKNDDQMRSAEICEHEPPTF